MSALFGLDMSDAVVGGMFSLIGIILGAVFKRSGDAKAQAAEAQAAKIEADSVYRMKLAELEHEKARAVDTAAKELRESLERRVEKLEGVVADQADEITALVNERVVDVHVRIALADVLAGYPDPPGAPRLNPIVQAALEGVSRLE